MTAPDWPLGHDYGPHRSEDEPEFARVHDGKGKPIHEVPMHPLVQAQRRQINQAAAR